MSLYRVFPLFWLAVVVLSPTFLAAGNNKTTQTIVKFCAPENSVYPFFINENGKLSGINPDMLRQIFDEKNLPEAVLQFLRRPWKRCNADLESGAIDMMIGGFAPNRSNVVYPLKLGFALKDTVISTADVCFFSRAGKQMERTRKGLKDGAAFIVGIEAGFSKQHNSEIKPQWVELFNPMEKYRMLAKERVDAVVQVCAMDGAYPIETMAESVGFTDFEALYPPYLSNPAYVIFSERFAKKHTELAKRIVIASLTINKVKVYEKYQSKSE